MKPCIPDEWPGFRVELRLPGDGTRLSIDVKNPAANAAGVAAAAIDGRTVPVAGGEARIPLTRDGSLRARAIGVYQYAESYQNLYRKEKPRSVSMTGLPR